MRLFSTILFILFNIYLIESASGTESDHSVGGFDSENVPGVARDKSDNLEDVIYDEDDYVDGGRANSISEKEEAPKNSTEASDAFPNEVFLSLRNITADAATAFRSFTNRNDVVDLQASASDNLNVTTNDTFGDAESAGINLRALRDAGHVPQIVEEPLPVLHLPYKHTKIDTADLSDCALQGEWKPIGVAHGHLHVEDSHQTDVLQSVGTYAVPSKAIPHWQQSLGGGGQDLQEIAHNHKPSGLYSGGTGGSAYGSGYGYVETGLGQFQKIKSASMLSPPPVPPIIFGKKPGYWKLPKTKHKFFPGKGRRPGGVYGYSSHGMGSGHYSYGGGGGHAPSYGGFAVHSGHGGGLGISGASGLGHGLRGGGVMSLSGGSSHGYGGGASVSGASSYGYGSFSGGSSHSFGGGASISGGSSHGSSISGGSGHGYGGGASISGGSGHGYGGGASISGGSSHGFGGGSSISGGSSHGYGGGASISGGSGHGYGGGASISGGSSHGFGGGSSISGGSGHGYGGGASISGGSGHGFGGGSTISGGSGHGYGGGVSISGGSGHGFGGGSSVSAGSGHGYGTGGLSISGNSGHGGGHGGGLSVSAGSSGVSHSVGGGAVTAHLIGDSTGSLQAVEEVHSGDSLSDSSGYITHGGGTGAAGGHLTASALGSGVGDGQTAILVHNSGGGGHLLALSHGGAENLLQQGYLPTDVSPSGGGGHYTDSTFSSTHLSQGIRGGNSLPDASFLSSHLNQDFVVHGQGISDDLSSPSTFTCGKNHDHNTNYHTATFQVADHDHPSSVDVLQYGGDAAVLIQSGDAPFHDEVLPERKHYKALSDSQVSGSENELSQAAKLTGIPPEQDVRQTETEATKLDDGEEPERHSYYHEITKVTKIPATSVGTVEYTFSKYETKPQTFSTESDGVGEEQEVEQQPQIIQELEHLSNKFQLDLENPQKLFEDPPSQELAYHYPFQEGEEEGGKPETVKEEVHEGITEFPYQFYHESPNNPPKLPPIYKKPVVKYLPRPGKPNFHQKVSYPHPKPLVVLRKHKPKQFLQKKKNYEVQEHGGERQRPVGEIFPPQKFPKQFHNPKPNFAVDRPKNGWRQDAYHEYKYDHGRKVKKFKTKGKLVAPILIRRPVNPVPVIRVVEVTG